MNHEVEAKTELGELYGRGLSGKSNRKRKEEDARRQTDDLSTAQKMPSQSSSATTITAEGQSRRSNGG